MHNEMDHELSNTNANFHRQTDTFQFTPTPFLVVYPISLKMALFFIREYIKVFIIIIILFFVSVRNYISSPDNLYCSLLVVVAIAVY